MAKSIADLMTTKIGTIEVSARAEDAAKRMKDKDVSSSKVTDSSNRNTGIATDRDLFRRVCASEARSRDVPSSKIMTPPGAIIDPFSQAEVAADDML